MALQSFKSHSKYRRLKDKIIKSFVSDLKQSNFYQVNFKPTFNKCLKGLDYKRVDFILCYGLGSFHNGIDITSRYQLALLLLIYEHLAELSLIENPVIELYDPSFDDVDKQTLLIFTEPRFKLIDINEYCARELITLKPDQCVLVYMPHLDKPFYNNILGANWTVEHLKRLLLLGNSFKEMVEYETISKRNSELHYINQLVYNFESLRRSNSRRLKKTETPSNHEADNIEALIEIPIDDKIFEHSDIFNSLSFHYIDGTWLANNSSVIVQSRLSSWTCFTNCQSDEWDE